MILSVLSIIKPWCRSSVYKIVQLASIAEVTIMAPHTGADMQQGKVWLGIYASVTELCKKVY